MKQRIDLQKAAEAEAFGALAVGANRKHRSSSAVKRRFKTAPSRTWLARWLRLPRKQVPSVNASRSAAFPSICRRTGTRKSCPFGPALNSFRKFSHVRQAGCSRSICSVNRLTLSQSLQIRQIALNEGKFFGAGPALELQLAAKGGGVVRMGFGIDEFDGTGLGGGFAA